MRKYLRKMVRNQAERNGVKASKAVKDFWVRYQVKKYDTKTVATNKAIGTHPKKVWASRIASV